ncbi:DNase I-like protein, partial [Rozella allomycis CSF55]
MTMLLSNLNDDTKSQTANSGNNQNSNNELEHQPGDTQSPSLYIYSQNVHSFNLQNRSDFKKHQIDELIRQDTYNVYFFQETWSNDKDIQHWLKTSGLSKLVHCYTDTPHNAINTNTKGKGTCIMINKHLNPHVQSHWEFPDRAVLLQLNIKDKIYLLGSIYVPSNPNTVDQRHETQRLFDFIETTINNLPRTTIIILGGDWNSVLNPMLDRTNNDTSKIPELKQMHKLMRKKFYDPFRHLHSLQQDFTFSHRNKDTIFEARLDYFL